MIVAATRYKWPGDIPFFTSCKPDTQGWRFTEAGKNYDCPQDLVESLSCALSETQHEDLVADPVTPVFMNPPVTLRGFVLFSSSGRTRRSQETAILNSGAAIVPVLPQSHASRCRNPTGTRQSLTFPLTEMAPRFVGLRHKAIYRF